jgi:mRNA interferase MazF
MSLPLRGEVWLVDLGIAAKIRPVLVLSVPFADKDYALFHIIPHTTAARGSQFEVEVKVPWLEAGVFNIQGSLSVPRPAFIRRLGALGRDQLGPIEDSIRRWLVL